ncbi:MAG: hypothetical protein JOY89_01900 [Solirubrobacterales bacterium]|nr:hypothetical protein [Solirubrobacterales bacterium]
MPPGPASECHPAAPRAAPADRGGASSRSAQAAGPPTHAHDGRPAPSAGSHRGGQCVVSSFDEVPWHLILKAVRAVTDCRWVLLYVERWLRAPIQHPDGVLVQRTKGTPQGSAVSPVLANLFMHYAFDSWMAREFPGCPFERYADDGVPRTLKEASM